MDEKADLLLAVVSFVFSFGFRANHEGNCGGDGGGNGNLREFACLTAVILTPLRVEAALDGPSATSFWLARLANSAKRKSME